MYLTVIIIQIYFIKLYNNTRIDAYGIATYGAPKGSWRKKKVSCAHNILSRSHEILFYAHEIVFRANEKVFC